MIYMSFLRALLEQNTMDILPIIYHSSTRLPLNLIHDLLHRLQALIPLRLGPTLIIPIAFGLSVTLRLQPVVNSRSKQEVMTLHTFG